MGRRSGGRELKQAVQWRRLIDSLLDLNQYADVVLRDGFVVNVITREIYQADVALKGEYILFVGDARDLIGPSTNVESVKGRFVAPGFIDAHMHFESAMLTLTEFSRLSIPTGTTTLVADPHEIANVLGPAGIRAMIEEARTLPNRILFTVPCQVPDVPGLETAGYDIGFDEAAELLLDPAVQGIGEIQGFSNVGPVFRHAPHLIDDLVASAAYARSLGKTVEGNAPGLSGKELAAHILAGGAQISCHETTTKEEALEKLRAGVTVFMREGSSQRNMAECVRAITEEGVDSRKMVLVSDDLVPADLMRRGHMNDILRRTVAQGIDPVEAIQMATINPATHFGLEELGVLAPGKRADLVVLADLNEMQVDQVYLNGKKVASGGKLIVPLPPYRYPDFVKSSMKRNPVTPADLEIRASGSRARVRALEVIPDQNLTGAGEYVLDVRDGIVQPSVQHDVLPVVVVERHGRTGRIGRAFARGMTLQAGAMAESVSHDTHNIIACGTSYQDLAEAVNRVIQMGGGLALVRDGRVIGELPLPVAGLMTDLLDGYEVAERLETLHQLARSELGCRLHVPFMHLSFLSLATSPKWKITDAGLVDVECLEVLSPIVGEGD
ncbi:MAG: adenine deaminase [Kyrpidia sp.]|nr:adenine deaminase [Kyrpidia sp.]